MLPALTRHLFRLAKPPHCPSPDCPQHRISRSEFRYSLYGYYTLNSGRAVQRFRCLRCRRIFSEQTFSPDYWLKRGGLLLPVAAAHVAGSANRQIARTYRCAPSTVGRLLSRIGRLCILFHAGALRQLQGRLGEPVGADHFETFELTQDYPFGVATAVGTKSWFIYSLDPAVHRRAGRISKFQRKRLEKRPARRLRDGHARSFRRTVDTLLPLAPAGKQLVLFSDAHRAYRRAVDSHPEKQRILLDCYPNPPRGEKGSPRSAEARRRDARMFAEDLLHKIIRHSVAHHRRETIAFPRRLNAAMERFAVMAVWRNFIKGRSERRADSETPAMTLGLAPRRLKWKDVFRRRLFFGHQQLAEPWPELYRREWTTPAFPRNTVHNLRYAF